MPNEKWIVSTKRADFKEIGKRFGIDPVVARVIRNRGPVTEEEVRAFLFGGEDALYDPLLMKDMDKACEALQESISRREHIRVVGDYDADGVSSVYILITGLNRIGAVCTWDIPDRVLDGYGINERIVRKAADDGVNLILTCDNGISAAAELELAKELGMKAIVTDHHEVPKENGKDALPPAIAVIDPHRADCGYPFKKLCGAAVAWKLIKVLYERNGVPKKELDPLTEFAALATVADVMDLEGENRIIVKKGLKLLEHTENMGLARLMDVNGVNRKNLSAHTLGFILGPCINAAGRLENASEAMRLVFAKTEAEADKAAMHLKELNARRKSMTNENLDKACEIIENTEISEKKILVVYLPDCHESLAGIVAGKVREKYYKPAFVLTKGENSVKGSGRSIDEYSMYDGLCEVKEHLLKFGGHKKAAGLSLNESEIENFSARLNENCLLTEDDLREKVYIDLAVPISYLTEKLVEELRLIEPCGTGNEEPLFAEAHLKIKKLRLVGEGRALKLEVTDKYGCRMNAVVFKDSEGFMSFLNETYGEEQTERAKRGEANDIDMAVCYRPQINEWRGRRSVEIVIEHYCRIK